MYIPLLCLYPLLTLADQQPTFTLDTTIDPTIFQTVPDGYAIPKGLHIQKDMQNGETRVRKIIHENTPRTAPLSQTTNNAEIIEIKQPDISTNTDKIDPKNENIATKEFKAVENRYTKHIQEGTMSFETLLILEEDGVEMPPENTFFVQAGGIQAVTKQLGRDRRVIRFLNSIFQNNMYMDNFSELIASTGVLQWLLECLGDEELTKTTFITIRSLLRGSKIMWKAFIDHDGISLMNKVEGYDTYKKGILQEGLEGRGEINTADGKAGMCLIGGVEEQEHRAKMKQLAEEQTNEQTEDQNKTEETTERTEL